MSQDYKASSRRRDQLRRLMSGQYAAEKIGGSQKVANAIAKVLPSTTYAERWKMILKMDEDYRKKISKKGFGDLGAACHKGRCKDCVFQGCIHNCHKGQVWFPPFLKDGSFAGYRFMAWITPAQLDHNQQMA